MHRGVRQVQDLNDLHHGIQLLLNLLECDVITLGTNGHTRGILPLCGSYSQRLQVIGLSGKESRYLRQDTHIIFYIEGNPAFL